MIVEFEKYHASFPKEVSEKLDLLYNTIRSLVPEATEKMSYGIPTFHLKENLVHYAGYKHHIGFYPSPSGITPFLSELTDYKTSKGAIQFPNDWDLPLELITKIVLYRKAAVEEK